MQIRTRLTLQFLGIVATIAFGSLVVVYYISANYIHKSFYYRLKDKAITAAATAAQLKSGDARIDSSTVKIIDRAKKDVLYKEHVAVFDSINAEVYANNEVFSFDKPDLWLKLVREKQERSFYIADYEVIGLYYSDPICGYKYVALAGAIDNFGLRELENLRQTLSIVFMLIAMAAAGSGWFFAGRALSPISKVVSQVDSITASNLNQRLEIGENQDEIALLTSTFNKMLNRIENAFNIQKTFVANSSHELKNLLTVITSQLEVSIRKERSAAEYKTTLISVLEDIKNLNEVSIRLLELAKISGDESLINMEEVRIDEVLWAARIDTLKRNSQNRVIIRFEEMPDDEAILQLQGNEALLKTAFLNLMENACKFSDNQEVTLSLKANNKGILIEFTDKGIGIPDAEIPYIFEPFYRAHNTRSVKGHGIGLSLVQRIIKIHGGIIAVESRVGEGTTFKVTFMRA